MAGTFQMTQAYLADTTAQGLPTLLTAGLQQQQQQIQQQDTCQQQQHLQQQQQQLSQQAYLFQQLSQQAYMFQLNGYPPASGLAYPQMGLDSTPAYVGFGDRRRRGARSRQQLGSGSSSGDAAPPADESEGHFECLSCGFWPSADAVFCGQCGTRLQLPDADSASDSTGSLKAMSAMEVRDLVVAADFDCAAAQGPATRRQSVRFEGSDEMEEERKIPVEEPTQRVVAAAAWSLSLTAYGCRVVQDALEAGSPAEQQAIAEQLKGHVWQALESPHANHVLQRCIEKMYPLRTQFIIDEIRGRAAQAARHRYGCRIIQRIIEHNKEEQVRDLIEEILIDTRHLSTHLFGNYVLQHILEHGCEDYQRRICEKLSANIVNLSKDQIGCRVVRTALVQCRAEQKEEFVRALFANQEELGRLSRHRYGKFVMKELTRAGAFCQLPASQQR